MLCRVYRVEMDIQFGRMDFQLIDKKRGCVKTMMLAIHKCNMRRLCDKGLCCFAVGCNNVFVKGYTVGDGN